MQTPPNYWFPAKEHGYGWGLPITWQGWVVVVAFLGLLAAGRFVFFPPARSSWQFNAYMAVLIVAMLGICYVTGEPQR